MLAPVGWTEPIVSLEFELRGVVIAGVLGLEFKEETAKINVNEGFVIPKNTKVRIHNAGNTPLHLVEILRPGYKESLVKEYESFE
jgi:mannose-6-phosphate isomerase-like protein (cupin superfamily)